MKQVQAQIIPIRATANSQPTNRAIVWMPSPVTKAPNEPDKPARHSRGVFHTRPQTQLVNDSRKQLLVFTRCSRPYINCPPVDHNIIAPQSPKAPKSPPKTAFFCDQVPSKQFTGHCRTAAYASGPGVLKLSPKSTRRRPATPRWKTAPKQRQGCPPAS